MGTEKLLGLKSMRGKKKLNIKCPKCNKVEFEGLEYGQKEIPQSKDLGGPFRLHGAGNDASKNTAYKTKIQIDETWLSQFTVDELVNYDFFFSKIVGKRFFNDHYLRRIDLEDWK